MKFLKDRFFDSDLGIWISFSTFLAYIIYYAKARSFNNYYYVTARFIDFNVSNLISEVFITVVFLLVVYFFFKMFNYKSLHFILNVIYSITFFSAFLLLMSYYLLGWELITLDQLYWIKFFLYVGSVYAVWSMNKQLNLLFFVVAFMVSIFLAQIMGEHEAINKENYIILERNKQSYIVVNNYKDMIIIEPVNLKTNVITPQFQFIELKSNKDNNVEMRIVHTGKLKVEESWQ